MDTSSGISATSNLIHGVGLGGGVGAGVFGACVLFKDQIIAVVNHWLEGRRAERVAAMSAPDKFQDALLSLVRKDLEDRRQTEKENLALLQSHAVSLENITASARAHTQGISGLTDKVGQVHEQLIKIEGMVQNRRPNGSA